MSNNVINNIGYSGEVTAKLSKDNDFFVKIHNKGFKALWDTLAKAVCGYDVSSNIPARFGVYEKSNDSSEPVLMLYSTLPFSGCVWGNVVDDNMDSTSARFTAIVTVRDRIKPFTYGKAVLRMFDKNGTLLAEIEDDNNRNIAKIHNSMVTGVNAVYEWKMTFKNIDNNKQNGSNKNTEENK